MDLYNEEKGKLRKKDKSAYYYNTKKKFTKVPDMADDKSEIYNFIKLCINTKHPDIGDATIQEEWLKLEQNTPLIIDAMEQLKAEAESTGADIWKVRSYDKAIKTIQAIHVPIVSGEQAMKLPGIGKGMAGVISEVLKHGRLKTQEERMEGAIERQSVTEEFVKVWDVNARVANQWYNFGHRIIQDVLGDKKLKLTEKQKLGLKYFEDLRDPSEEDLDLILKTINRSTEFQAHKVGPARRGVFGEDFKVVELLVCVPKIGKPITKKLVDALKKSKFIKAVYEGSLDAKKFSGIVKTGNELFRVDIYTVNKDECGPALIQHTGPESFVKQIKEQAAVMGYGFGGKKGFVKFSETDDNDEKIDAPIENVVFSTLGLHFVDPSKRM
jgi:DNA polymerase/3'-5' exonuclease PolX